MTASLTIQLPWEKSGNYSNQPTSLFRYTEVSKVIVKGVEDVISCCRYRLQHIQDMFSNNNTCENTNGRITAEN